MWMASYLNLKIIVDSGRFLYDSGSELLFGTESVYSDYRIYNYITNGGKIL